MTVSNITTSLLEKVRSLQADIGPSQPPFDPLAIPTQLGVNITVREVSALVPGALLFREGSGYVIQVDSQSSQETKRFRVAHEIGHILLDIAATNRLAGANIGAKRISFSTAMERACDLAASEILMPLDMIKEELAGTAPSLIKLQLLSERYKVSYQVAAIRAIRAGWRCIAFMTRSRRGDSKAPLLSVAWVAAPYKLKYLVQVGQPIPRNSIIYFAHVEGSKFPEELRMSNYHVTHEHSQLLVRREHLVFGKHRDLGWRPVQARKTVGGTLALIPLYK